MTLYFWTNVLQNHKCIFHWKYSLSMFEFHFFKTIIYCGICDNQLQALFAGSIPEIIDIVKSFPKHNGSYVNYRERRHVKRQKD